MSNEAKSLRLDRAFCKIMQAAVDETKAGTDCEGAMIVVILAHKSESLVEMRNVANPANLVTLERVIEDTIRLKDRIAETLSKGDAPPRTVGMGCKTVVHYAGEGAS